MTTAIQLKRYAIPFILIEKERVGGLLWNANLVENYPGFPAGVSGPKLIGLIQKQMERIGVEVTRDSVNHVSFTNPGFLVETSKRSYRSQYVVVASGTRPKLLSVNIPENAQNRVFSDVFHLLDSYDKQIAIVGAGDAAFDYALNLVKRRNFVTILNRSDDVKCLGLLWERSQAESLIEYQAGKPVRAVRLDAKDSRLKIQLDAGQVLKVDYLLFAIGRFPQTDFLSAELIDKKIEGLYFIGDVKNGLFRQTVIAAGDGLRAAMDIHFKISSED